MEVYILDSLLRRIEVVDTFESFIWTERYAELGDFELTLKSTRQNKSLFIAGTKLATNKSYRVMTVGTVEDTTDSDGKSILKVKGKSLEALLKDRVARNSMANLTTQPKWTLLSTPAANARKIFNDVCVLGVLNTADIIPFMQPGNIFPADTIPEYATQVITELEPKSVYDAIKDLCEGYDMGFRLVRNFDTSQLYFNIYTGNDRTTQQQIFPPVVFSAEFGNLQDTTELTTIEDAKNVAYVFSSLGTAVVYADDVDPDVEGFERHVLVVNVTDVDENTADVQTHLQHRAQEELMKSRGVSLFDGELGEYVSYVYDVDYRLGDLVELRNKDGEVTKKRVTEQIFVHDEQGERSYPTLSAHILEGTGTWAQFTSQVWSDFTTEAWADL